MHNCLGRGVVSARHNQSILAEDQMMLNDKASPNASEIDALNSVNPVVAILYLFVVAFVFTVILPGLH